jgi:hypothetical protein
MALFDTGVNYAKSIDPSGANVLNPGIFGGKLRVMQDYYVQGATSLNSTDYIVVGGKLPTGAQVVSMKICMGSPLASNASIVVGDEGDADRYITSTRLMTGGTVGVGPTVAGGMYYTVTGVTDNYIRVAGASTASIVSGASLKISVMYIVE